MLSQSPGAIELGVQVRHACPSAVPPIKAKPQAIIAAERLTIDLSSTAYRCSSRTSRSALGWEQGASRLVAVLHVRVAGELHRAEPDRRRQRRAEHGHVLRHRRRRDPHAHPAEQRDDQFARDQPADDVIPQTRRDRERALG